MSQPFQSAVDLEGGSRERLQVTELIGTSTESWEDAAATAVRTARETLRDLRVAEVAEQTFISTATVASRTAPAAALLQVREELNGPTAVSASDQAMTDGSLPQTATVGIRGSPALEAS